jgi:hypothetical protein
MLKLFYTNNSDTYIAGIIGNSSALSAAVRIHLILLPLKSI